MVIPFLRKWAIVANMFQMGWNAPPRLFYLFTKVNQIKLENMA